MRPPLRQAPYFPSSEGREGGPSEITPLPAHYVRRPPPPSLHSGARKRGPGGGRQWRRWLAAALAVTALIAAAAITARADNYPAKTITIIAPASPGGVTDMLARLLARRFIADWGAQAIVENKPGANNQVAAEYVARQPGDGKVYGHDPDRQCGPAMGGKYNVAKVEFQEFTSRYGTSLLALHESELNAS